MDFTKAYHHLISLNLENIRYDYSFQKTKITIFSQIDICQSTISSLFVLVTTDSEQVVEQITLVKNNDNVWFSGYWNNHYNLVREHITTMTKLTPFWDDCISRLENLKISDITPVTVGAITQVISSAKTAEETIYPHYLKQGKISPKQQDKIRNLFGKSALWNLQRLGVNLVFTKNPLYSKNIILQELELR